MEASLKDLIEEIKRKWTVPKPLNEISEDLLFRCQFFHGFEQIESFLNDLPQSFVDFYTLANGAFLFEDVIYGQWGLQLLDVFLILQETNHFMQENKDYAQGDLIIAQFLGDSDLLLLRTDPTKNDYGSMMIVMPLERRNNWNKIELDFYDFIKEYVNNLGQKFWE